ncbi:MAG: hypothetical protein KC516_00715 [Nanoarchaeota archaeon]|nr:hypothetical protein [Nanoarchaeota archaeon]
MEQIFKLLIGVAVLLLGIPIGSLLARWTKEELKEIQKWIKLLVILGVMGGIVALIFGNDAIMFSCFFVAVVSSRSLIK